MKHIGIYTYLLVTIGIMTSCKENFVYDNPLGNRVIELTTEIGAKQPTTRVALSQKEDSYDMITTWQEGDQVQLVFQQDGHIYDAGTTTVYDITNGGKICKIRMSIPDEIDVTKPYLLTGITELKLTDDNGTLCCQSPMIRTRLADFKGRIMFQQELEPGGSRYVRFSNFGTYEVMHIKNTTAEPIQFEHCGFDAELKWYHGKETYRFADSYDPTAYDYSYQSGDAKSTAFTIPAGSTETFVSWYIPSGGFISDASLKATINGQSVTSSNKLSSSVPIEARKAYHMYATWDGKELKFREDDMPVGENIETITINGVSFNMVRVDGGTFMMGANEKQTSVAYENEFPAHKVTLSTYYIGETEVIQRLWKAVMGEDWYFYYEGDSLPVNNVSYSEIQEFLLKLNKLTGKNFRLPSEAEWEFAAKGGIKSCNYIYSGSDNLTNVTSTLMNISNVARFQPNELGIYDMSGNVDEFCADDLGQYSADDAFNPQGPVLSKMVAVRGDSWSTSSPPNEYWYYRCRTSYRGSTFKLEGGRARYRGFRLVMGKPWVNNIVEEYISSMVYVQGGTFLMGGEPSYDHGYYKYLSPQPAHQVELSSFYISKYEVPQLLWETVMGDNPSIYKGEIKPVENVSWNDCQEFITRLNNMTNKHFRLPTEAEWEYSARGGCLSQGFAYAGSDSPGEVTAAYYNYFSETMEVVGLKPNELDIYNMSGNVSEWCQDICAEYTSDSCINPQGSQKGIYRIHRGGGAYPFSESWFFYVRNRYYDVPETRDATIGLRLVLDL